MTSVLQQAVARDVDLATARQAAMEFLSSHSDSHLLKATQPRELWSHAEPSSLDEKLAAYYIIGTDKGFVVVAGDDRARRILAYSDTPVADVEDLPAPARFWLDLYKRQIEVLQSQPGADVSARCLRSSWYHSNESITPLLHSVWSQTNPFNKRCPLIDGKVSYAGCSAVALAQVMRYWEYPEVSDTLPPYVSRTHQISVPALDSTAFDWSNMLDNYPVLGGYTTQQQEAVSTLLRYVGQAEHMDYKPQGSDADEHDILDAIRFFGYDKSACYVEKSTIDGEEIYPDNIWSAMLWNELKQGRPVVYCAWALEPDSTLTGHAFNVDGYDADTDTYHVNFGWRGTGDGYYALNAFLLSGYQFDIGQLMFLNVMPPRPQPVLWVSKQEVRFDCHVGDTVTQRIIVAGSDLIGEVTVALNDTSGLYSLDVVPDVAGNTVITVTFAPQESGNSGASLTVSSQGAQDVTVVIAGNASLPVVAPVMLPADSAAIDTTSFCAQWTDASPSQYVEQYVLEVASSPEFDPADSCYRVITAITDSAWVVDSLMAGGTYFYRVQAVYTDGTVSAWSNVEEVTLLQPEPPHGYELGDVNHDGCVDISDVAYLIDCLLRPDLDACPICADVRPDGVIDISDLAALIDLILTLLN